jgi:hypothetical protein
MIAMVAAFVNEMGAPDARPSCPSTPDESSAEAAGIT